MKFWILETFDLLKIKAREALMWLLLPVAGTQVPVNSGTTGAFLVLIHVTQIIIVIVIIISDVIIVDWWVADNISGLMSESTRSSAGAESVKA